MNISEKIFFKDSHDIDADTEISLVKFLKNNNNTYHTNTSELSIDTLSRLKNLPYIICLLYHDNNIVGSIMSVILETPIYFTSYTLFLCVHKKYRNQGFCKILINILTTRGQVNLSVNNGYFLRLNYGQKKLKSWYRPLNVKKIYNAGFTLKSFSNGRDKKSCLSRQIVGYFIPEPPKLPTKATSSYIDYNNINYIFDTIECQSKLKLTYEYYLQIIGCFDIYYIGTKLFMIIPMSYRINKKKITIKSAQLSLMIGNLFTEAIYISQKLGYDILYGWCNGDITEKIVEGGVGHMSIDTMGLNFYNMTECQNGEFYLPLF